MDDVQRGLVQDVLPPHHVGGHQVDGVDEEEYPRGDGQRAQGQARPKTYLDLKKIASENQKSVENNSLDGEDNRLAEEQYLVWPAF